MAARSRQWQPKLGGEQGERVYGLDELEQSLRTILKTPVRSVPGRPEFGSSLHEVMDEDVTIAGPKIAREVVRAVKASDDRITVLSVTAVPLDATGQLVPRVHWRPTNPISAADAIGRVTTVD